MKKLLFILLIAGIALCAFISPNKYTAGIHGIIDPADGAKRIWAVSGTDSVSTTPSMGNFSVDVRPGTWKVVVEAVRPYKNAVVEGILVQEGQSFDAGVIKLVAE